VFSGKANGPGSLAQDWADGSGYTEHGLRVKLNRDYQRLESEGFGTYKLARTARGKPQLRFTPNDLGKLEAYVLAIKCLFERSNEPDRENILRKVNEAVERMRADSKSYQATVEQQTTTSLCC
jgi:hypothetical protein